MTLILKYLSWLFAVGVGFAGSWLFEFTVTDEDSQRKRLTRSGKWGAGLALVGLVSALCWTVLDDLARQREKAALASFQSESARRQTELQESQAAMAQKQDELDDAVEVVTFLLREERGEGSADERRRLRQSLAAISGLLTEREKRVAARARATPPAEHPECGGTATAGNCGPCGVQLGGVSPVTTAHEQRTNPVGECWQDSRNGQAWPSSLACLAMGPSTFG